MNIYQNKTTKTTITMYESDGSTPKDISGLTGEFIFGNKKDNSLIGTGTVALTGTTGELTITVDGSSLDGMTVSDFGLEKRTFKPEEVAFGHLLLKDGTDVVETVYLDIDVFFEIE